ncbi:hypothetical protein ABVT39_019338 [Epinephelus coioides]
MINQKYRDDGCHLNRLGFKASRWGRSSSCRHVDDDDDDDVSSFSQGLRKPTLFVFAKKPVGLALAVMSSSSPTDTPPAARRHPAAENNERRHVHTGETPTEVEPLSRFSGGSHPSTSPGNLWCPN